MQLTNERLNNLIKQAERRNAMKMTDERLNSLIRQAAEHRLEISITEENSEQGERLDIHIEPWEPYTSNSDFFDWLQTAVMDDEWTTNPGFFQEIILRKLTRMGRIKCANGKYVLPDPKKDEDI